MFAVAELAQDRSLEEFARDPILTVACVLLIVVSIGWLVVARVIARNLRRAEARTEVRTARSPRDIWNYPPP